jgi:hypothetical protein
MDPYKPMTDSTDLLRGICDAQLSSDSTAFASVLRDAMLPEDTGNKFHRGPTKIQLRGPEHGRGPRAERLPKFDAERAWR